MTVAFNFVPAGYSHGQVVRILGEFKQAMGQFKAVVAIRARSELTFFSRNLRNIFPPYRYREKAKLSRKFPALKFLAFNSEWFQCCSELGGICHGMVFFRFSKAETPDKNEGTAGRVWSCLVSSVQTKYVLLASDIFGVDKDANIERMARIKIFFLGGGGQLKKL